MEREPGGKGIRQECRRAREKGSIDRKEELQCPLAETGAREVYRKMESKH